MTTLTINDKKVLFITGSGISAESGLRTFYSENGLYSTSCDEDGHSVFDILSQQMLHENKQKTWTLLNTLYTEFSVAKANPVHEKISKLIENGAGQHKVLTMNVDGFHGKSPYINEIHGNIHDAHCSQCFAIHTDHFEQINEKTSPPICGLCGEDLHPGVVLFDQMPKTDPTVMTDDYDVIVMIGVGSPQHYILDLIIDNIANNQAKVHFVDPNQTLSDVIGYSHFYSAIAASCTEHKEKASTFMDNISLVLTVS